jgi:hypothetical protein
VKNKDDKTVYQHLGKTWHLSSVNGMDSSSDIWDEGKRAWEQNGSSPTWENLTRVQRLENRGNMVHLSYGKI